MDMQFLQAGGWNGGYPQLFWEDGILTDRASPSSNTSEKGKPHQAKQLNFRVKTIISETGVLRERKKKKKEGGWEGSPLSLRLGMGAGRMGRWMEG